MSKIIFYTSLTTIFLTTLLSSCGRQPLPQIETSPQYDDKTVVVRHIQEGHTPQAVTRIHFTDIANQIAKDTRLCLSSCSRLTQLSVPLMDDHNVLKLTGHNYAAIEIPWNGKIYTKMLNQDPIFTSRRDILVDIVNGEPHITETVFPPDITDVVLVQPRPATKLVMGSGMEILIPAQAVSQATLLGIDEQGGGMPIPGYQFWPELQLEKNKRAKISLNRDTLSKVSNTSDFILKTPVSSAELTPSGSTMHINVFNHIAVVPKRDFVQTEQGISLVPETVSNQSSLSALELSSDPCAQSLAQQLSYYKSVIDTSGSIRISACEDIFPHIMIIMVDLNRTNYEPDIAYDSVATEKWRLRTVDDHGTRSGEFVTINGFNFSGNEGRIYEPFDTFGFPVSTVVSDGVQLQKRSAAEAIMMFYKKSNTPTKTRFRPDPEGSLSIETGNTTDGQVVAAVGSGTSIINNNECISLPRSGDGPFEISALGMGNGRIVFISSARKYGTPNTDQVYSGDLCAVFKSLNATQGAIRLDSGSAAQLAYAVNGSVTLLNPHLVGSFERTVYGVARRIAYGVGVKKIQ